MKVTLSTKEGKIDLILVKKNGLYQTKIQIENTLFTLYRTDHKGDFWIE